MTAERRPTASHREGQERKGGRRRGAERDIHPLQRLPVLACAVWITDFVLAVVRLDQVLQDAAALKDVDAIPAVEGLVRDCRNPSIGIDLEKPAVAHSPSTRAHTHTHTAKSEGIRLFLLVGAEGEGSDVVGQAKLLEEDADLDAIGRLRRVQRNGMLRGTHSGDGGEITDRGQTFYTSDARSNSRSYARRSGDGRKSTAQECHFSDSGAVFIHRVAPHTLSVER